MSKFEAIQMRFDEDAVVSPVVELYQSNEPAESLGEARTFNPKNRILVPTQRGLGPNVWVSVVEPFTAHKVNDRKVDGLTAYQTPIPVPVFYGRYQTVRDIPQNTIFGAYVRPNIKKR